ncbi:hypothetical protein, partial [uncultured Hyphomicrobium sp.]|uniref:hypothetical protein n=1 Tax=uncultured Hyphomicrobium sp. TaxID=194373 RepID=UPI0025DF1B1F
MGFVSRFALATALTGALALANPAIAGCKRMGFTVNDYGKDGPTRDAKDLLDKHIATWAAEQGIEKYTVGKKDVDCELYLNLIVVDEHTCTANATVCWGPDINKVQDAKAPKKPAAKKEETASTSKPSDAAKEAKPSDEKAKETASTGSSSEKSSSEKKSEDTAAAPSESDATEQKAAETKPAEQPTAVETGTIPVAPAAAAATATAAGATTAEPAKVEPDASANAPANNAAAAAAASSRRSGARAP